MCTLILGVDVIRPGSVIVAANRDEDPARPADPPRVLMEHPRLVGGRDARAGGTWLAVRGRHAVVALLNRRSDAAPPPAPRSRGLLTLDVAAADGAPLAAACERRLREAVSAHGYAPFSMVFAARESSWVAAHHPGRALEVARVAPGWHVVTHEDLDDRREPRTAWLLDGLAAWRPATLEDALAGLTARLSVHTNKRGGPAVCIHDGRMSTVSASLVWLAEDEARYLHAEGRPCVTPWFNHSQLLAEEVR